MHAENGSVCLNERFRRANDPSSGGSHLPCVLLNAFAEMDPTALFAKVADEDPV